MKVRQRVNNDPVLENDDENSQDSHSSVEHDHESKPNADWHRDKWSISLLLFLYLLQGIPLGMAASIPLVIQTYGASWSQQATFSFAFWPFSLKLLWAPIVDALYIKRFGRRKTWLIPTQYAIGLFMILLSYTINDIIATPSSTGNHPNIIFLTAIFFGLSFLAATQDVCVDGWALSMLSRDNVGWASTCNSVGQTAGYFLGNVIFLALESKDFANRYVRQPLQLPLQSTGLVTLPGFLLFWGLIFAVSTTVVALFKHETNESTDEHEPHFGLVDTYKVLFRVLRLPAVRSIAIVLLTIKISFAAVDTMTGLELMERGVSKDTFALLAIPLTPLEILLPFLISKYTNGKRPLSVYTMSHPFRLLMGVFMALFVFLTPYFQNYNRTFPWYYYALAIVIFAIQQVFVYSMFVSQMAFFAKVSDPKIGGTYMTLLNTLTNLGSSWVSTTILYMADFVTWKTCSLPGSSCSDAADEKTCALLGGICRAQIDPYYILVSFCTLYGLIWLIFNYGRLVRLQELPMNAWQVRPADVPPIHED